MLTPTLATTRRSWRQGNFKPSSNQIDQQTGTAKLKAVFSNADNMLLAKPV